MNNLWGILGGTFNPIHIGHLIIAEEACVELGLEKVFFVLNKIPPHKDVKEVITFEDRFNMLSLALEDNLKFVPSDLEIYLPSPSYTVNTIEKLKEIYTEVKFFFICGADAVFEYQWYRFTDILAKIEKLVIHKRKNYSKKDVEKLFSQNYPSFNNKWVFLESLNIEISASKLRERLKKGVSLKYLLPDKVLDYITAHKLYIF